MAVFARMVPGRKVGYGLCRYVFCFRLTLPFMLPVRVVAQAPEGVFSRNLPPNTPASDITLPPIDVVRSRADKHWFGCDSQSGTVTKEELDLGRSSASGNCWRQCRDWW